MILDSTTELATAYAPGNIGTNANSTILDLGYSYDWGMGATWTFFMTIVTSLVGAGATVDFQMGVSNSATFGSGNTVLPIDVGAVALASLVAGYQQKLKIPRVGYSWRYARLQTVVATANVTAGTVSAWLTNDDMQDNLTAAAGYSVL